MASSIPATLNALVALWTAAQPTVMFVDAVTLSGEEGKTVADNIGRRVIVGGDPESDVGVTFDREWAAIGRVRMIESFDIPCHLECVSGDEDATALRTAAFTLLDALSAALAADNTLGGLVAQGAAVLGTGSLTADQDEEGARAAIRFVVHCLTRINQ